MKEKKMRLHTVLVGVGCLVIGLLASAFTPRLTAQTTPVTSRQEQLILEGAINDLCARREIRSGLTGYVRCYANVSLSDIIVYVYPQRGVSALETSIGADFAALQLPGQIKDGLLDWPDWEWARGYTVTVVDRTRE
jgi:hypothetical protein